MIIKNNPELKEKVMVYGVFQLDRKITARKSLCSFSFFFLLSLNECGWNGLFSLIAPLVARAENTV